MDTDSRGHEKTKVSSAGEEFIKHSVREESVRVEVTHPLPFLSAPSVPCRLRSRARCSNEVGTFQDTVEVEYLPNLAFEWYLKHRELQNHVLQRHVVTPTV